MIILLFVTKLIVCSPVTQHPHPSPQFGQFLFIFFWGGIKSQGCQPACLSTPLHTCLPQLNGVLSLGEAGVGYFKGCWQDGHAKMADKVAAKISPTLTLWHERHGCEQIAMFIVYYHCVRHCLLLATLF